MFVLLLTTLNTHFIWSFSVSVWFKQSKQTLNIDGNDHKIKQKNIYKSFTTKIQHKTCFYISTSVSTEQMSFKQTLELSMCYSQSKTQRRVADTTQQNYGSTHPPTYCALFRSDSFITSGCNDVLFTNQVLHYGFLWQKMSWRIQQNSSPAESRFISDFCVVYQHLWS